MEEAADSTAWVFTCNKTNCNFHSCTVHLDTIESFIYPTDAQLDCSKGMLKFALQFTW